MQKDRLRKCFRPYIKDKDKYERQRQDKEALRRHLLSLSDPVEMVHRMEGSLKKCSERLRSLPAYRKAQIMYVSLNPLMEQVRYNALMDGKMLVVPSPQLKRGFFLLDPSSITPSTRLAAVRTNRVEQFGRKINFKADKKPFIDLTISEVVAADVRTGALLCDGTGFYDLHLGIMGLLGWLKRDCIVVACPGIENSEDPFDIPVKENDSIADYVVMASGIARVNKDGSGRPPLIGEILDARTIRRSDVLFYIFRELLGRSDFSNLRLLRSLDAQ